MQVCRCGSMRALRCAVTRALRCAVTRALRCAACDVRVGGALQFLGWIFAPGRSPPCRRATRLFAVAAETSRSRSLRHRDRRLCCVAVACRSLVGFGVGWDDHVAGGCVARCEHPPIRWRGRLRWPRPRTCGAPRCNSALRQVPRRRRRCPPQWLRSQWSPQRYRAGPLCCAMVRRVSGVAHRRALRGPSCSRFEWVRKVLSSQSLGRVQPWRR